MASACMAVKVTRLLVFIDDASAERSSRTNSAQIQPKAVKLIRLHVTVHGNGIFFNGHVSHLISAQQSTLFSY